MVTLSDPSEMGNVQGEGGVGGGEEGGGVGGGKAKEIHLFIYC